MKVSNCCYEKIIKNTDICSKCKEHCIEIEVTECCESEKIIHKGELVCSCCGMKVKKDNK